MTEEKYLSVSLLTSYLKRKFDLDPYLKKVYLTGEISNFRMRPNTHQYFSIKDDQSKINVVMFKSAFQKVKFTPEEGMKVLIEGHISIYPPTGSYQFYIDNMQPDGIGALYAAYEQLKKKLFSEGLFSAEKKQIPKFPNKIAVITSPSGSVIQDIITTVQRRYPKCQIVLFPAIVQGEKAKDSLIRAIQQVEQSNLEFETLIIGRGGGSIEDLWPFNEEQVVRALYHLELPIISSVGHETDTTLSDLVADVRAATPTAAAEIATPNLPDVLNYLTQAKGRLYQSISKELTYRKQALTNLTDNPFLRNPSRIYEQQLQLVDQLSNRLQQTTNQILKQKRYQFEIISQQVDGKLLSQRINHYQTLVNNQTRQLTYHFKQLLHHQNTRVQYAMNQLDALSPLNTMKRGYTYTENHQGQLVKTVDQLAVNQPLTVHYQDGSALVDVREIKKENKDG
ncbi:exodeoxyribonuclease VII large subunit [Holzapfeliella sp. He02]|uniref:Exodeoxyribonuclease 7 large subunit n=1 Tax=Holzapfeliella saturejae TaxID=3082953 RepID=A0ABU8SGW5_9LACO